MTIIRNKHVGHKTVTGIGKDNKPEKGLGLSWIPWIEFFKEKKKGLQFVWWGWHLWWDVIEECEECGRPLKRELTWPFGFSRSKGAMAHIYDWYLWLGFFEIRKWHKRESADIPE